MANIARARFTDEAVIAFGQAVAEKFG